MGKVQDINGNEVDYDSAVATMDKDIAEELHTIGYETDQEFFDAYAAAHAKKYDGEEWAPYYNLSW